MGCSSGHPDQDETVAQAGIDALLKEFAEVTCAPAPLIEICNLFPFKVLFIKCDIEIIAIGVMNYGHILL